MSDIKLNQWTWDVVPELHPEAIVRLGGNAVLSLGPPEMPEEELRLPEGWEVDNEDTSVEDEYALTVLRYRGRMIVAVLTAYEPTRAECVREINRILGGT